MASTVRRLVIAIAQMAWSICATAAGAEIERESPSRPLLLRQTRPTCQGQRGIRAKVLFSDAFEGFFATLRLFYGPSKAVFFLGASSTFLAQDPLLLVPLAVKPGGQFRIFFAIRFRRPSKRDFLLQILNHK